MERKLCRGILAMLLSLVMVITLLPCSTNVQAKTWTKSAVNKKITALNKQIKKYKKKDKAAKKGKIPFYGNIISYDPLVVQCSTLMGTSYYWINNPEKVSTLFDIASGWGKKTGEYRDYGDYTCSVLNAVSVKSYTSKINSLKKKRKKFKAALTCTPFADNIDMTVGDTKKLEVIWSNSSGRKFNVCKFTSSDESVVEVDKKGNLHAVGIGTAEITLKGSVSGKSSTIDVNVSQKVNEIYFTNATDVIDYGDGLTQSVYIVYLKDGYYLDIETETDIEYNGDINVEVDEYCGIIQSISGTDATIELLQYGSFIMQVEAGGAYNYCTVVAVDGSATDIYENTFGFNEKEYYAETGQEIYLDYFMDVEGNGIKYLNYEGDSLEHQWYDDVEDLYFVASTPGDYEVSITDWFGCTDTCVIHVQ